jgi:hypothetical protein
VAAPASPVISVDLTRMRARRMSWASTSIRVRTAGSSVGLPRPMLLEARRGSSDDRKASRTTPLRRLRRLGTRGFARLLTTGPTPFAVGPVPPCHPWLISPGRAHPLAQPIPLLTPLLTPPVNPSGTRLALVSAAHQYPDLHELVDQLNPAQADAVRAVVIQFIAPAGDVEPIAADANNDANDNSGPVPRVLAFVGAGASEHAITPRIEELLADGFGRD